MMEERIERDHQTNQFGGIDTTMLQQLKGMHAKWLAYVHTLNSLSETTRVVRIREAFGSQLTKLVSSVATYLILTFICRPTCTPTRTRNTEIQELKEKFEKDIRKPMEELADKVMRELFPQDQRTQPIGKQLDEQAATLEQLKQRVCFDTSITNQRVTNMWPNTKRLEVFEMELLLSLLSSRTT